MLCQHLLARRLGPRGNLVKTCHLSPLSVHLSSARLGYPARPTPGVSCTPKVRKRPACPRVVDRVSQQIFVAIGISLYAYDCLANLSTRRPREEDVAHWMNADLPHPRVSLAHLRRPVPREERLRGPDSPVQGARGPEEQLGGPGQVRAHEADSRRPRLRGKPGGSRPLPYPPRPTHTAGAAAPRLQGRVPGERLRDRHQRVRGAEEALPAEADDHRPVQGGHDSLLRHARPGALAGGGRPDLELPPVSSALRRAERAHPREASPAVSRQFPPPAPRSTRTSSCRTPRAAATSARSRSRTAPSRR